MEKCEKCERIHDGKFGSGRFCTKKCSSSYSTQSKRKEINEKIRIKLSKENSRKCDICNDLTPTKRSNLCSDCKPYSKNIDLFKKLGVYIKNTKLNILNKQGIELLTLEYFTNKKSKPIIMKEYNLMSNTIYDFFKKNDIKLRNLSESLRLAISENRLNIVNINNQYTCGYHTSWDNQEFYYRSSYELEYCEYLDTIKEKYLLNIVKIEYFDTQSKTNRTCFPDLFLIDSNTLIEIKCTYSLDIINMIDKVKKYLELGYKFKLILDKKDMSHLILDKL